MSLKKFLNKQFFISIPLFAATLLVGVQADAATKSPADVLDLSSWKLTLPTGKEEKPTEIKMDALKTFSQTPFFQINKNETGIKFLAPVNGFTTSGSGYPRSELREMTKNGKENASWSTTSGAHSMFIEQAITAIPKKKQHVVAGQIHDSKDDVIVIRLEYPKLFIDVNGKKGPVLDENYELGKKFTVQFIASDGKIQVYYNGQTSPAFTLEKKGSGNYFKAGVYTQSNCSKESVCQDNNYGEVNIYNLQLQHAEKKSEIAILNQEKPLVISQNEEYRISKGKNNAEVKNAQESRASKRLKHSFLISALYGYLTI